MFSDDDIASEPTPVREPVERDEGVLIEGSNHADRPDDEGRDIDYGQDRDPELWSKQLPLIEEDIDDGLKLDGFSEEAAARVLEAMGDDAAETLADAPNGTSATGVDGGPDHGGFPERE